MNLGKENINIKTDIVDEKLKCMCGRRSPSGLALRALSMYDRRVSRKKHTRRAMIFILVSLIPLLAILLAVIIPFLGYDLVTILGWFVKIETLTTLGYCMIIIISIGIALILARRIWKMRCVINDCLKEN